MTSSVAFKEFTVSRANVESAIEKFLKLFPSASVDDFDSEIDSYKSLIESKFDSMASKLLSGQITQATWSRNFREELKNLYVIQYLSLKNTLETTDAELGILAREINSQYTYLRGFKRALSDDSSAQEVLNRSKLYIASSHKMRYLGQLANYPGLQLPTIPGAGDTVCLMGCGCEWIIEETETFYECTWALSKRENCIDCVENSKRWNPLVIKKDVSMEELITTIKHLGNQHDQLSHGGKGGNVKSFSTAEEAKLKEFGFTIKGSEFVKSNASMEFRISKGNGNKFSVVATHMATGSELMNFKDKFDMDGLEKAYGTTKVSNVKASKPVNNSEEPLSKGKSVVVSTIKGNDISESLNSNGLDIPVKNSVADQLSDITSKYAYSDTDELSDAVVKDISSKSNVPEDTVREFMFGWNNGATDPDSRAGAMKAIADEFGMTQSEYEKSVISSASKHSLHRQSLDEDTQTSYRKIARTMYDTTQLELKERGITELAVHRGMVLDDTEVTELKKAYNSNSVESWTSNYDDAQYFTEWADEFDGTKGIIVSANIPASRIMSFGLTGIGTSAESEFVVFPGKDGQVILNETN